MTKHNYLKSWNLDKPNQKDWTLKKINTAFFLSSILGDSLGFMLQNFHLQGYENILEKRIWDLCTITSPELQKHHCMWKSYKFISQITPIFRSTILQSIAFFFLLQFYMPVFVSYGQFPGKRNGRIFYCLHLQTARKCCFLDCILLLSSLYHHCSFAICKQKAARKEILK